METERLIIRELRLEDWKSIQSMWIAQAHSPFAQYIYPKPLDDRSAYQKVKNWVEFQSAEDKRCLVICFAEKIIGYVTFRHKEHDCEIGYCFHSDFQGKGYAKESLSAILMEMNQRGISGVLAQTALKNTPSVRLLRSLGFQQIDTIKKSIRQDGEENDIFFDDGLFRWSR